ncbi:methyltransferase domain-containing protein [Sphingomonas sp. AOB5]|uniref:methyltransferase domain-containing protein n=1 Tax=Sphingomonas sp. AOB5 TaxID=3034017 RepID=UPI0023F73716|nr:methyltransferase domain-containing protein [Sphingomonas sp. AOB5]MDF7776830.1 methyltransferase domain-containing protein [Sphingomonas sp. AOB5]
MAYRQLSQGLQRGVPFLRRVPGMRTLGRAARYLLDARYRDERNLRLFRGDQLFQASAHTWAGRYPHLFGALSSRLATNPAPRILSFGCSTGEEVRMIRQAVPHAHIIGIDISPKSIRTARARNRDPQVEFILGGDVALAGPEPFDAIVCMAVLQRSELSDHRPEDSSAHLTFARYEAAVRDIDAHLRPGGLLALYHTNFRLSDTDMGGEYQPILCTRPHAADRAKYDRDNRLTALCPEDSEMLFVKRDPAAS